MALNLNLYSSVRLINTTLTASLLHQFNQERFKEIYMLGRKELKETEVLDRWNVAEKLEYLQREF
jgi:hypothetical protein